MTDTIFTETNTETSYLETLVGDGKKYKTIEDLAKGYANLEPHADSVKRELSELRAELEDRLNVKALLEETRRHAAPPLVQQESTRQDTQPARDPALSDEELVARIQEVTKAEKEQELRTRNVQSVAEHLISVLGSQEKANEVVNAKAVELGVPVSWLQDMAAKSPKAFFTTVGVDSAPKPTGTAPQGQVNTAALGANASNPGVKPGTYRYYRELQTVDPKRYFTPKVQNQMMKDALDAAARGENFYL